MARLIHSLFALALVAAIALASAWAPAMPADARQSENEPTLDASAIPEDAPTVPTVGAADQPAPADQESADVSESTPTPVPSPPASEEPPEGVNRSPTSTAHPTPSDERGARPPRPPGNSEKRNRRELPVVRGEAGGACSSDGGYEGWVRLTVINAPATIQRITVLLATQETAQPDLRERQFPLRLADGSAEQVPWTLHPPDPARDPLRPEAVLVQVRELPGDPAANALANRGDGWLSVPLPDAQDLPCPVPQAVAATPTEDPPAPGAPEPEEQATPASLEEDPATAEPPATGDGDAVTTAGAPSPEDTVAAQDGGQANSGLTRVEPNNAASADPGQTVSYRHTVTHLAHASWDIKNITAVSSQGWTVALFEADGTTPLTDHDGDGIPDTGRLNRGESRDIVVKVTVPPGTPAGTVDITTVTATPTRHVTANNTGVATDRTTVNAVATLTIETGQSVNFGTVRPDGALDPAVSGVTSIQTSAGALYLHESAVVVTVTTNTEAWAGVCWAEDLADASSGVRAADGQVLWRLAGELAITPFTTGPAGDSACFPTTDSGVSTYAYDYLLDVRWDDQPGRIHTVVTYAVSPLEE